ncbi:MAG TPA: hypothetical protein VJM80_04140 [bacterium]|nr:hypothetical protein [bacterium]
MSSGFIEILVYLILASVSFLLALNSDNGSIQLLLFLLTAVFFFAMFRPRQSD